MKIFVIEGGEEHEFTQLADPDDYALFDALIDGTSRSDTWTPFAVKLISKGERRRSLLRADAPFLFSSTLILRTDAAEILKPSLTGHGELLPLICEQTELVAFNAFHVIDALDEAASTLKKHDSGRIMRIAHYVFHKSIVQGLGIFKITSLQPSPLFVSEEFVERWRAAGLEGLDFKQVWEG